MDYLQTDPDIDPTKVAVIGHSRGGKAALWAGAQDTRFAAAISNDSGSTGAKLARRGDGGVGAETVAGSNNSFPHWYPPTYKAYNNRVRDLPVDQHELLALIAPRRVVIAQRDRGHALRPAGRVPGLPRRRPGVRALRAGRHRPAVLDLATAVGKGFRGPAMSYHLRSGGHGLTASDWGVYLAATCSRGERHSLNRGRAAEGDRLRGGSRSRRRRVGAHRQRARPAPCSPPAAPSPGRRSATRAFGELRDGASLSQRPQAALQAAATCLRLTPAAAPADRAHACPSTDGRAGSSCAWAGRPTAPRRRGPHR